MPMLACRPHYTSIFFEHPFQCGVCKALQHAWIYRIHPTTLKSTACCVGCDATLQEKEEA